MVEGAGLSGPNPCEIEIAWDNGKLIRFSEVSQLVEFLKKVAWSNLTAEQRFLLAKSRTGVRASYDTLFSKAKGVLNQDPFFWAFIFVCKFKKNFAIGRKTWNGTHSERGAKTAAILFSLTESCKLNDINPREYFKNLVQDLHNSKAHYTPKGYAVLRK